MKDLLIEAKENIDEGFNDFAKRLIDEAISELEAPQPRSCDWKQCDTAFDTSWEGTCGAKWNIEYGTPKENHMSFCPQCGGKLIQIEPKEQ